MTAITEQDEHKVKLIIVSHSKRITSWALLQAAKIRSSKSSIIIKILLDYGAPIDGFDCEKRTPLVEALIHRNLEKIWILVDHRVKRVKINIDDLLYPNFTENNLPLIMSKEEKSDANKCICLLIEQQGAYKCEYLISLLSYFFLEPKKTLDLASKFKCNLSKKYLYVEYKLMQFHLAGQDFKNSTVYVFRSTYLPYSTNFEYRVQCDKELGKIKKYEIQGSITLCDFLIKTIDEILPFTRNNDLTNKIRQNSFINEFPCYGETLQFKVEKAAEKRLKI